ncbi:MAG: DUF1501 domain-containing protein [Planctomycetales bacterium]|nr:DUF1501 domain-containing protein [Planctomycetales bacterium]
MNLTNNSCNSVQPLVNRRSVLQGMSCGFGWLAFGDLASRLQATESRASHFPAKAKHVILLCMRGGPSHVDTLDYKPQLTKDDGKPGRRPGSQLLGSPWKFSQHGESGLWLSELLPNIAKHADRLCVLNAMQTDVPAHPQAFLRLHTGTSRFVRPSLGAWTLYGLGSENENLPGFVTLTPPSGFGGAQNYGAAFLPASNQATRIGSDNQRLSSGMIPNLKRSQTIDSQREELDLLQQFNRAQLEHSTSSSAKHAPEIEGLIESFELGFRMQAELPRVFNLDDETEATKSLYGINNRATEDFGKKCLLARRLVEAGVRFVEVTHGNWDQHFNLRTALENNCQSVDLPAAGLIADLHARNLLDETLVIWSGEFGRTPHAQGGNGRDHNNSAFSCWMAGGGTKGGFNYGQSDEYGYEAIAGATSIHDWHATILRLLGIDHEQLTFRYAGRDFRLTDVYGQVIEDIIA